MLPISFFFFLGGGGGDIQFDANIGVIFTGFPSNSALFGLVSYLII